MMDLQKLCLDVVELSREVGIYIKMQEGKVKQEEIEEKSLNSLVSHVDKMAEKKIVEGLLELLPEAGFIAEEGTSSKKGEKYDWIIDPLDGTTNFLFNIPIHSVSIALKRDDQIVLGVIYEVNRDECFYAWEGGKAYLNGTEITVRKDQELGNALLATGFPYYDYERVDNYFDLLKSLAQKTRGIRRMGSAAIDLAYVACGRFDGFFEYSLQPWDVAAGAFIVKQAGGMVSDFSMKDNWLFGNEIIACSSALGNELQQLVKQHMINNARK
jgi:myo-inositol-1(or 4)-monophosphatase